MFVPFSAGGSIDIVARAISQPWSGQLHQQIVIDNRGGAGGTIGAQLVADAAPDGYTLLYANSGPLSIGPILYGKLGYDVFRSFAPVSHVTSSPFMIFAIAALPPNTVAELVAYAKQRPGQLNYASSGIGSGLHLMGELFKSVAGVDLVHVPFKGMGQAMPELVSGRVQLAVSTVAGLAPQVKAGRLKGIVSSGMRRSAQLPDVPTCTEAGIPALIFVGTTGLGAGLPGGDGVILDYCHPRHLDWVAAHNPQLKIVAARPGWPWQAEVIAVLMHKRNIWYELHGWSPKYHTADLKHEIPRRLKDRILFGADYPLFSYERLVKDWRAQGYGEDILERVFWQNGERFLAENGIGASRLA